MKPLWFTIGAVALVSVITLLSCRRRAAEPLDEFEVTVADIPAVFERVKTHAENESFAVFVFAPPSGKFPDDAINIQFCFEDERVGLDWVLLGQPNIKDKDKYQGLASSLGYTVFPKSRNGVDYLRAEEGDLPRLCERAICDLYSLHRDSKIGLLLHHVPWP